MKRLSYARASLAFLACLAPVDSWSHSFGTPYVPPVPFWMYAYGCAATLLVTFILLAFLAGAPANLNPAPTREIRAGRITRAISRWTVRILRVGATGCLLLTILSGLIGSHDAAHNIGMTLFWVVFLLGFAYLTLLVGDLYALINPWRLAVSGLERLGLDLSRSRFQFPAGLGYWPAFVFYAALIWLELFGALHPSGLSIALLIYSAITLMGVAAFGKAAWFGNAELFSVFFRLIGKLAPVEYSQAADEAAWKVRLRPPLVGALDERPWHMGMVLFVLFMLSSTTYDSIHDTALWIGIFWKNVLRLSQPLWGTDLGKAQDLLMNWYLIYRQAGLVLFPFLYLGFYLFVLLCAKALIRTTVPVRGLALEFCYSLLPIAVAYHFAHYCAFLAVQGEELPKLISDPFGFGWNLLGLSASEPAPLNMGVLWHTQVAAVLLGHLASAYLAHVMAMRAFPTRHQAVVSQLPLLLLMVVYTMIGLWVLSLPLGEG